jgi:hypothetical protein
LDDLDNSINPPFGMPVLKKKSGNYENKTAPSTERGKRKKKQKKNQGGKRKQNLFIKFLTK